MNGTPGHAHPHAAAHMVVRNIELGRSPRTVSDLLATLSCNVDNASHMRRLIDAAITERELTDGEAVRVRQSVCAWFAHDLWKGGTIYGTGARSME